MLNHDHCGVFACEWWLDRREIRSNWAVFETTQGCNDLVEFLKAETAVLLFDQVCLNEKVGDDIRSGWAPSMEGASTSVEPGPFTKVQASTVVAVMLSQDFLDSPAKGAIAEHRSITVGWICIARLWLWVV